MTCCSRSFFMVAIYIGEEDIGHRNRKRFAACAE